MDLILSTYLRAASDPVAEPATGHAVDRLGVVPFAVEYGITARLGLDEENHALIGVPGAGSEDRVLLDAMERPRSMLQHGLDDVIAVIRGIGQAHDRGHIRGQVLPHLPKHPAIVDVRLGQLVAQDQERIRLDGQVGLHPVLARLGGMRPFPPWPLPPAEAGGVGGDGHRASRQRGHDEVMEALPDV